MHDREPDIDVAIADRRQARRFGSVLPLHVDGARAQLTDVSATGVGFVTEEPLEPGNNVSIGIRHLPDDFHPPSCNAEVVRVEEEADGSFLVGARLDKPLDTGRTR